MKKVVHTSSAPAAIGPYSQGIAAGGFVFTSGQLPIDPATGSFAGNTVAEQTRQSLLNVKAILESAGTGIENVVKVTVYLQNMDDFSEMNNTYMSFFPEQAPARSAVEVSRLPKDALVEIEAVAIL
ncbi:MAG: RidA family protein [Clostridiales bacterium]|jgi:2-iminobutanoate/2-iminopropanoate deaminase|nr:RidA family protein [Clostridiales bacterium]